MTKPSLSTNQASRAPCSIAACRASTFGNSPMVLMSTRPQRLSGTLMTAMPFSARGLVARSVQRARRHDEARRHRHRRESVVAPRHAAADLQIDDAVADAVARHHLAQHDAERARRHRHADAQFGERALQPLEMAPLVDQATAPHLADFIDAVGELIAAILDMDLGVAHRQIAAVDVGYAGHWAILDIGRCGTSGINRSPAP